MFSVSHILCLTLSTLLLPLAGNVPANAADSDSPGDHAEAIATLTRHFHKRGVDLGVYLEDPSFEVYDTIGEYFQKAPEKKAGDAYLEALERGDEEAAERIFDEQYADYKRRLGFDKKTRQLVEFLEAHAARLDEAEDAYDISREIIAAIIGIESNFGQTSGKFNPFNVYVSMYLLAVRQSFALEQLTELVTFSERTGSDVFAMTSSYAGAIGYMQFIPYSLNHYFVGTDVLDMNDNIISVANYLNHFRTQRGSMEKAIHAYNPSRVYVRLVKELADSAHVNREAVSGD